MSGLIDGSDKPVAALRHSFDVLASSIPLSKKLAQDENVLVEVTFLNESLRPDPFYQLILVYQVPCTFYEHEKRFDHLGSKEYRGTFTHQDAILRVQAKRPKRVEGLCFLSHRAGKNFSRNFPELQKDFTAADTLPCPVGMAGCDIESRLARILVRQGGCKQ